MRSSWMRDGIWDCSRGTCAIGAALTLTKDAALLSRVETFTIFFETFGLTALTSPSHLG